MQTTDNTYYRSVIISIETVDLDVDPLGPNDIYGEFLDNNIKKLQK